MSVLLLPDNQLDGSHSATLTIRPQRAAYLLDVNDPSGALAAIEAASLEWGGRFHFLIPCTPGGRPDDQWSAIVEKYDPDVLVDLVGVDTEYVSDQENDLGRIVYRWEQPLNTMHVVGPLIYGPLRKWAKERPAGRIHRLLHMTPLRGHPLALPLAFQLGHIDLRPMDSKDLSYASYHSSKYQDFIEIVNVDPAGVSDLQLAVTAAVADVDPVGFSEFFPLQSGYIENHTLPSLSGLGVERQGPAYSYGTLTPEYEQHDEAYLQRIVVLSAPDSVPDLCLVWNLRAQRQQLLTFPMWLDPQRLGDADFIGRISLGIRADSATNWVSTAPQSLHLVSASLATAAHCAAFTPLANEVVAHSDTPLDHFFTRNFRFGTQKEMIVTFQNKIATVPIPDLSAFGYFYGIERLGYTFSVRNYRPPAGGWRTFERSGQLNRIATDGFAGFLSVDQTGKFLHEGSNDAWQVLTGIASRAGYSVEPGDKGQLGIGIMRLVGEANGLDLLASDKVYALLRDMAAIVPTQAVQQMLRTTLKREPTAEELHDLVAAVQDGSIGGGQFERQHHTYDKIQREFGVKRPVSEPLVKWLVEQRILLRGYVLKCPRCGVKRWYPIARLEETHRCDGCQNVSPTPLDRQEHLVWQYRLNEIMARAVDQGVLPHLLVARRLLRDSRGAGKYGDLLGLLPGVKFHPKGDTRLPEIEVDLLAIKAGRVIIGECKASGSQLNATKDEVAQFAALAQQLNCSRIIYATPTDFSAVSDILGRARDISAPTAVEIWDGQDLLESSDDYLTRLVGRLWRLPA